MKLVHASLAAALGAAVGAVVWVIVRNVTGFELGLIAWGIGVLAGLGAATATAGKSDNSTGFAAACVAVLAIAGAKYTFAVMIHNEFKQEIGMVSLTEENMIALQADEIALAREEAGERITWPDGYDYESATEEPHYPADIWEEAEAQWYEIPESDREQMKDLMNMTFEEVFPKPLDILRMDLSPFDVLWIILAFASAFKIGSGSIGAE